MSRPPSILFKPKETKPMTLGPATIEPSPKSKAFFSAPVKASTPVKNDGSKVIFGGSATKRNRINVSGKDLEKYIIDPLDVKYIPDAQKQIEVTNTDNLRLEYVLNIGKTVQDQHNVLLAELLGVSNHLYIQKTKELFGNIIESLRKFNIGKSGGFLSKMFSNAYKEEKTFTDAYSEIQEYIKQLQKICPNLMTLAKSMKEMDAKLVKINDLLTPYVISCAFFSEYKGIEFPNELFISRQSSLLSTQVSIKTNRQQAGMIHQLLIDLLDTFNNVVLTDVPSWCNSYITSQLQKTPLSETQVAQQNLIIQQLKSKIS